MSIFGDLDTTQVSDNPYEIKPDTYWAICTDAKARVTEQGQNQCVIAWTIVEPANEFHGNTVQEYYSLYPGKAWEDYSPLEKKATKYFKKRLREGFDLSESEVQSVQFSDLIGKGAFITVIESAGKEGSANAGKTFTNVKSAFCKRLHDEYQAENSTAESLGL